MSFNTNSKTTTFKIGAISDDRATAIDIVIWSVNPYTNVKNLDQEKIKKIVEEKYQFERILMRVRAIIDDHND